MDFKTNQNKKILAKTRIKSTQILSSGTSKTHGKMPIKIWNDKGSSTVEEVPLPNSCKLVTQGEGELEKQTFFCSLLT